MARIQQNHEGGGGGQRKRRREDRPQVEGAGGHYYRDRYGRYSEGGVTADQTNEVTDECIARS